MLLRYGEMVVGEIEAPFEHQGTWFGEFVVALPTEQSANVQRIREFIEFCPNWFERSKSGGSSATEFERFSDLLQPGNWSIEDSNGQRPIEAPMFQEGLKGEISWTMCGIARQP